MSPSVQVGDAVHDIRDETEHLTALVGDLLLLARTDSGAIELEKVPVDLADVAEGAVTVLTPLAAEKDVRAALRPGAGTDDRRPAAAPATGHDPDRQRDRALAAPGSTVTVSVGRHAGGVRLTVDDEGPGIRADDLPHVFDRFWRAEGAPSGGTGLGPRDRALGDRAARRHDRAANLPSGGARFDVRLPADPSAPGAATRRMLGPSRRPAPPTDLSSAAGLGAASSCQRAPRVLEERASAARRLSVSTRSAAWRPIRLMSTFQRVSRRLQAPAVLGGKNSARDTRYRPRR